MKASELRDLMPRALHRCTDQANANRIADGFDVPLVSVNRKFYALVGGKWHEADAQVAELAAHLPELIVAEAPDKRVSAERLVKWARRSQRKTTANAAMAMLKDCTDVGSLAAVAVSA